MKFTIDRTKWICGRPILGQKDTHTMGAGLTTLLNEQGYMCCLGHISLQLGAKPEDIDGMGYPSGVPSLHQTCIMGFSMEAVDINDDRHISVEEKEKRLIELLNKHGHVLEFQ